jgi:hypothetical protein
MVMIIQGYRTPVCPAWVETFIGKGLWQYDHESGRYQTIYRYAPGGRQPSFYTVDSTGRRTYYATLKAAVTAVEAAGEMATVGS